MRPTKLDIHIIWPYVLLTEGIQTEGKELRGTYSVKYLPVSEEEEITSLEASSSLLLITQMSRFDNFNALKTN